MGEAFILRRGGGKAKLKSIAITTPPTQTSYIRGQAFNPAGMVVTADIGGVPVVVTTYAVTPTVLSLEDTGVTVSFTAGGVTCTATQSVTVTGEVYLYNDGLVEGVAWESNGFKRPNYPGNASGKLNSATMEVNLPSVTGDTAISYNAHLNTTTDITIPDNVTTLHVIARKTTAVETKLRFGLLPIGAANALSTANGGQLSNNTLTTDDTEYTITLNEALYTTANLRCVVNGVASLSKNTAHARVIISKVWFE